MLPREEKEEERAAEIAGVVWWQFLIYIGAALIVLILLIFICLFFCSGEAQNLGKRKSDKVIEMPEQKIAKFSSKDNEPN